MGKIFMLILISASDPPVATRAGVLSRAQMRSKRECSYSSKCARVLKVISKINSDGIRLPNANMLRMRMMRSHFGQGYTLPITCIVL